MDYDRHIFLGIDPGAMAGHYKRTFTYAALDSSHRILTVASGDLADVLAYAGNLTAALAAVNGPASLNRGLQPALPSLLPDGSPKPTRMRQVEHDLRTRGLHVPATPGALEACPRWMTACLHLHQQLRAAGFLPYPADEAPRQVLETQAEALYAAWTGSSAPMPASSLEGRLQRQLALLEQRIPVPDAMNFFEEITRYRLLHGALPFNKLHTQSELNALAAAAAAWLAAHEPEKLHPSGDPAEGVIYI